MHAAVQTGTQEAEIEDESDAGDESDDGDESDADRDIVDSNIRILVSSLLTERPPRQNIYYYFAGKGDNASMRGTYENLIRALQTFKTVVECKEDEKIRFEIFLFVVLAIAEILIPGMRKLVVEYRNSYYYTIKEVHVRCGRDSWLTNCVLSTAVQLNFVHSVPNITG